MLNDVARLQTYTPFKYAKPQYLGDPALPIEFDPYLYRLEQKERASRIMRIREHGSTAVAMALSDLIG
jgi:hypothetical protein